jgi:hypothetical protein
VGRDDEARSWFARAAAADPGSETDAAERAADLDQLGFDDLEDDETPAADS